MSKLVIVIDNIPDKALDLLWRDAQKEAKKAAGGFSLQQSDTVTIDFKKISEDYPDNREILSSLVGSAISGHLVMEVDKYLNQ